MELLPKIGIANIRFGLQKTDIEKILGKPDRILIDEDEEAQPLWEYQDLKLRLTFYNNEEGKLGYIRTGNTNLTFNGENIIGVKIEIIKILLSNASNSEWEFDDYFSFSAHFNEKYWITLNEEYGAVHSLEMGVPFKNDDEYDWPEN